MASLFSSDELALVSMKLNSIDRHDDKTALAKKTKGFGSEDDDEIFDDYMLALQLQMQNENCYDESSSDNSIVNYSESKSKFERDNDDDDLKIVSIKKHSSSKNDQEFDDKPALLVDPEFDLLDPCPDIYSMFQEFDKKYFWSRLGSCLVEWSKRMTICAGIFYLREGGIIRLSEPLLKYRPRRDLVQTLLHEMIHAYLYLTRNFKDRGEHGDEFKGHMNRINKLAGTNITVYHSFHDEVNHARQHVWRCTGPCRTHAPFYGYVKRSMNRAPGKNDTWWNSHQQKCNGQFEKISEPESYKKKNEKKEKSQSQNESKLNTTAKPKESSKKRAIEESLNSTKIDSFFTKKPKTPSPTKSCSDSTSDEEIEKKQPPPMIASSKTVSSITITKKTDNNTKIDINQKRLEFFNSKAQLNKNSFLKPLDSKAFNEDLSAKATTSTQNKISAFASQSSSPELYEIKEETKKHPVTQKTLVDDITILSNSSVELIDDSKVENDSIVEWVDEDIKLISEKKVECPVCAKLVDECNINVHVNQHFS